MGWHARLALAYERDAHAGGRTIAHDRHEGPLRVLQRLYPEGPGICHHVVLHPPGGIVGGDVLEIEAVLAAGTHAVVTTPGAARFYRSAGDEAVQRTTLALAGGARLEWLPLETIAHGGCIAANELRARLAPGAELMAWDVLALGLPAAGEGFDAGCFRQHLELPGRWLERGTIAAGDKVLLDGPLGLAGQRVLGTMWFAAGSAFGEARREALLDAAREVMAASSALPAGATSPQPGLVVLRALAQRVEPLMLAFQRVRAAWREAAWSLPDVPPRVWRT